MKIIYTIIVLLLATTAVDAYEIIETVTDVIDGDTFKTTELGNPILVRIADIDCPELQQPGGQEAKKFTVKTLLGKLVSVKTRGKSPDGSYTGRVTTNHGKDMAVLLTKNGLAWARPDTINKLIIGQQSKAQKGRLGVWSNTNPEPPWQYRGRTRKVAVKRELNPKISLYGDSVTDIPRDPDGSAIGDGGGMTIIAMPQSKQPAQQNQVASSATSPRQQPKRGKHITADDYTIKLSVRQSGDYVEFSGRISDGPLCKNLRVSAYADSDGGGSAHAIDVVRFSSGVRSQTFDGKYRYPWYKKSQPKPQWEVHTIYASCSD